MEGLQELWENIPMWVVIVAVLALIGGGYLLVQYLHLPMWVFWGLLVGVGGGFLLGFAKSFFSGGM